MRGLRRGRAAGRGICRRLVAKQRAAIVWPTLCLTAFAVSNDTRSTARARIYGRCAATHFRLQRSRCCRSRSRVRAMFTSVHSSPSGKQYVSMTLDCAILSRQKRPFEATLLLSSTTERNVVPFKGVVARVPTGGVCPIAVQRAQPHFSAVSDRGRVHALGRLSSIFAPRMHVANVSRSPLDRAEMQDRSGVRAWGAELCSDVFWLYAHACDRCSMRNYHWPELCERLGHNVINKL